MLDLVKFGFSISSKPLFFSSLLTATLWSSLLCVVGGIIFLFFSKVCRFRLHPGLMHGAWLLLALRMLLPLATPDFQQINFIKKIFLDNWQLSVGIWVAGFVIFLFADILGSFRLRRRILRDEIPVPEWMQEDFSEIRREIGINSRPILTISENAESPVLLGIIRPVIAIPKEMSREENRAAVKFILRHELEHLKGGDLWLGWVWSLARAAHWFNPFCIIINKNLKLWREMACDRRVTLRLNREEETLNYAETLLELSSKAIKTKFRLINAACVIENLSETGRRIEMITMKKSGWLSGAARNLATTAALVLFFGASVFGAASAKTDEVGLKAELDEFAKIKNLKKIIDEKDKAMTEGDLVRASIAEIRRAELRLEANNVWADKVSLNGFVDDLLKKNPDFAKDKRNIEKSFAALTKLAEIQQDKDYFNWRIWLVCADLAKLENKKEDYFSYLQKSLKAYPNKEYPSYSKQSFFHHILNKAAACIYETKGIDAAIAYIKETWQNDDRFRYFYESGVLQNCVDKENYRVIQSNIMSGNIDKCLLSKDRLESIDRTIELLEKKDRTENADSDDRGKIQLIQIRKRNQWLIDAKKLIELKKSLPAK